MPLKLARLGCFEIPQFPPSQVLLPQKFSGSGKTGGSQIKLNAFEIQMPCKTGVP